MDDNICHNKKCECYIANKPSRCGEFLIEIDPCARTLKNSCMDYIGQVNSVIVKKVTIKELKQSFDEYKKTFPNQDNDWHTTQMQWKAYKQPYIDMELIKDES